MKFLKKKYLINKFYEDVEIEIDVQSPLSEDFEINIDFEFDSSIAGIELD